MAYGQRLAVHVLEDLVQSNPTRLLYSIPRTLNPDDGFQSITSKAFAEAVDRASWWLHSLVGKSKTCETIGYMGPNDLRYRIFVLAAMKTGHKLLLNSPRNSVDGHLNVIKGAQCNTWLIPDGVDMEPILSRYPMTTFHVPDLPFFLDGTVKEYPYHKTFTSTRNEPCLVLHTSGSTSLPKPIELTHGCYAAIDAINSMRPIDGQKLLQVEWSGLNILVTFPPFHAGGVFITSWGPLFFDYHITLPPPLPSEVGLIEKVLNNTSCDAMILPPSTVEDISKSSALSLLRKLQFIAFGGGPLSREAGDLINKVSRVHNCAGTTEAGWYPVLSAAKKDWEYFHFHPDNGYDFRMRDDGLYEHVIVRTSAAGLLQPIFETFPELQEWSTKDLYEKHPSKPNHWYHRGRGDDIIVFSNGEKFNPLIMEASLGTHPLLKAALIFGQGRFQTGALLELVPERETLTDKQVIDAIWPLVERNNLESPAHAKLSQHHVLIASAGKPFHRAPKGTVMKRLTLEMYSDEINSLYDLVDIRLLEEVDKLDTTSLASLLPGVKTMLISVARFDDIQEDDDIFSQGFDSLQVLTFLRVLRAGLRDHESIRIDTKLLYANPTIFRISLAIYNHIQSFPIPDAMEAQVSRMQEMLDKYTSEWPPVAPKLKDVASKMNVVLTGSSGSLGSYLLSGLLQNELVDRIWCLNRSAEAMQNQIQTNRERGLITDWTRKRVVFLQADLSQAYLGLIDKEYTEIAENATHIIHNQWRVDFNLSLSSFEPQVRGVRHLLDLAAKSQHHIFLFFISSVATVSKWPVTSIPLVPETAINDLTVADMGYGEGKLVSELILDCGARVGIANCTTCRVAQVAGPVKQGGSFGQWNRKEWFPTIVDSSAKLGIIPETLGQMDVVDWIPVDILSDIILELSLVSISESSSVLVPGLTVFHTVNPRVSSWGALLPVVKAKLEEGKTRCKLRIVAWDEWVANLRQVESGTEKNPAEAVMVSGVKLLDFFEGAAMKPQGQKEGRAQGKLDVSKTIEKSTTMAGLDAVSGDWLDTWLDQWGY